MPRPQCQRNVRYCPPVPEFIACAGENREPEFVELMLDEFEALRLADYEGLYHEEASREMGISRPTFTRLIEQARKKVSQALVEGKGIRILGGPVQLLCGAGRGHGRAGGFCYRSGRKRMC